MSTLHGDILSELRKRRQKVLDGGINGIPVPFTRFRQEFPTIEPGRYFIVTGATKASKTQLANYLFIYNTVLYCYHHPEKIRVKIFFFPLEETKEQITLRFEAFLLHYITNGAVNISPADLRSTDERKPVREDILNLMESAEFKAIFDIYDNIVTFCDSRHPTGIFKTVKDYMDAHGSIKYRTLVFDEVDELTGKHTKVPRQVFDKYIPDDPDEMVIAIVDHVGLLTCEKDTPTIKQTIEKLSDYMVILRNKYGCSYVGVQQQNMETTNLEAFKNNKIRPTKDGLKDSKRPGEDCDVLIGMTCPNAFELKEYLRYDLTNLKDNFKVLEVVLNRGGRANVLCPLYHDGAINFYRELPRPDDDVNMNKVYAYISKQRDAKNLSAPITNAEKAAKQSYTFLTWAQKVINNIIN